MADAEYIPSTEDRSDEELILSIATGDPTATAELYARYRHSMRAVAGRVLNERGQGDDADDVVHETFTLVITTAADVAPIRASVRAWLHTKTHYTAMHLHNRRHRPEGVIRTVELTEAFVNALPQFAAEDPDTRRQDQEQATARREAESTIAAALVATLKPMHRDAVEAIYRRGLSRKAAAAELGITERALKQRIATARAALAAAAR